MRKIFCILIGLLFVCSVGGFAQKKVKVKLSKPLSRIDEGLPSKMTISFISSNIDFYEHVDELRIMKVDNEEFLVFIVYEISSREEKWEDRYYISGSYITKEPDRYWLYYTAYAYYYVVNKQDFMNNLKIGKDSGEYTIKLPLLKTGEENSKEIKENVAKVKKEAWKKLKKNMEASAKEYWYKDMQQVRPLYIKLSD
ncbi:hypothetical protein [Dysgonomonas sp. 25]|uniref:hypothetical protein n=1 Tax=Dysgonomonas sp. 25 TaxID=2302933 RepID=UPI0013D8CD15|nr:hypothetical protein [Dysgonomonas sp. 25]